MKKKKELKKEISPELRKVIDLSQVVSACLTLPELYAIMVGFFKGLADNENSGWGEALALATLRGQRPAVKIIVYKTKAESKAKAAAMGKTKAETKKKV